ncbi:MAG TPA: hypothetical protein VMV86_02825, partial [Methanosarcinales archaeon]|nr:hypothetical protein [Methanosarcinales archaeon]
MEAHVQKVFDDEVAKVDTPAPLSSVTPQVDVPDTSDNELPDYVKEAFDADSDELPDYVKKAFDADVETDSRFWTPEPPNPEWGPEWMREHPWLAGMYGAGEELLDKAVVPSIEATAMIGATFAAPWAPVASTALGYAAAANVGRQLKRAYKRLGTVEEVRNPTLKEEMIQNGADVATALVLGKGMEVGFKGAVNLENYLFETLPKRLYGSAIKTPMSKKWIQTLPDEIISKQTQVIEEGLSSRVPPSKYGLSKIKGLQRELESYIDDVTKIL